jgi:hypothetical protein
MPFCATAIPNFTCWAEDVSAAGEGPGSRRSGSMSSARFTVSLLF